MHLVRQTILDETERDLLRRVAHLVPLAWPTSDTPETLRPAHLPVVDPNDPRLRVLTSMATNAGDPQPRGRILLAVDVLVRLSEVAAQQADPDWWTGLVTGRPVTEADTAMAQALAAERRGQLPRIREALAVMEAAAAALNREDDPRFWMDAEQVGAEEAVDAEAYLTDLAVRVHEGDWLCRTVGEKWRWNEATPEEKAHAFVTAAHAVEAWFAHRQSLPGPAAAEVFGQDAEGGALTQAQVEAKAAAAARWLTTHRSEARDLQPVRLADLLGVARYTDDGD